MKTSPSSSAVRENTLNRLFWLYCAILAGIFVLACLVVEFDRLHGAIYPHNSLLFIPEVRFSDWTNFSVRVAHHGESDMLSRRDISPLPYPYPLASLYIYLAIVRIAKDSLHLYLILGAAVFVVSACWFYLSTRKFSRLVSVAAAIVLTLFLSEPMYYALDRGNIEVFLWFFVVCGLFAFIRDRAWIAAFFFAMAAASKIYPILFLLLLVKRKQYRAAIFGLLLTAAFSIGALYEIGPTVQIALQQTHAAGSLLAESQIVSLNLSGTVWDHSIFGMEKMICYIGEHFIQLQKALYLRFTASYAAWTAILPIVFVVLYFKRFRRLPLLNLFIVLDLISILFPYVSYEYTLIHVTTCAGVFMLYLLMELRAEKPLPDERMIRNVLIGFAIIEAPLSFGPLTYFPGQIKCLVLLYLAWVFVKTPLPGLLFRDQFSGSESATVEI